MKFLNLLVLTSHGVRLPVLKCTLWRHFFSMLSLSLEPGFPSRSRATANHGTLSRHFGFGNVWVDRVLELYLKAMTFYRISLCACVCVCVFSVESGLFHGCGFWANMMRLISSLAQLRIPFELIDWESVRWFPSLRFTLIAEEQRIDVPLRHVPR